MGKCSKEKHRTKQAAQAAAVRTLRANHNLRLFAVYRCDTCRFPDRAKAWHWARIGKTTRRKQW